MRLAFVDVENPEDVTTWSGIPYCILQEMRRQGIEVEVIAPLARSFRYWFTPHKVIAAVAGKNVQINRHPVALNSFAAQIERRIGGRRFDAIFSTSSIPTARLNTDTPVVFWTDAVTEAMSDYYEGSFANLNSRELRIAHVQEQDALDRSSFAVYASDWAANAVKHSYPVSKEKVRVIRFGANLAADHTLKDVVAFNDKRLNSECVLLFIGIDWDRKGGAIAFETARLLNERGIKTVLKVVGGGGLEASFVETYGFINKNTAEGREKIKRLLEAATFFILPTRAEAAGIVFCEAAAYGLPALTTNTGGVESYVIDSDTGYCLPLAAGEKEYADIIERTLAEPGTYRRLSENAFQRYKQTLNWSVGVSSLLRLIEQAVRTK